MFALFDNLGGTELVVVLVAALLVFGRRLPQVASDAAKQLGSLKRNLDDAWRSSGVEKEIREIQRAIPRDLSVASVARQAAKRFEERVAEVGDEAKKNLDLSAPPAPSNGTVDAGAARAEPHTEPSSAPSATPSVAPNSASDSAPSVVPNAAPSVESNVASSVGSSVASNAAPSVAPDEAAPETKTE